MTLLNSEMLVARSAPSGCQGEMKVPRSQLLWKQKAFSYLRAGTFQCRSIHMHIAVPQKAFPFETGEDNHVFEIKRCSPATSEIFIFFPHVRDFNHLQAIITQEIYCTGKTKAKL